MQTSMSTEEIQAILKQALGIEEIRVVGENSHFTALIVDDELAKLSPVKRQQTVFAPLMEHFANGAIHALDIQVFTKEKWEVERKLNGL